MNKDHSPVQWTLPRWAADLIRETIELDSRSERLITDCASNFPRRWAKSMKPMLPVRKFQSLKRQPMKSITIHRLSLQFDAGQITQGSNQEQAKQALDLINGVLQREPFGLGAQLIAAPDEIEVESVGADQT